jgi:hypothetical protein
MDFMRVTIDKNPFDIGSKTKLKGGVLHPLANKPCMLNLSLQTVQIELISLQAKR